MESKCPSCGKEVSHEDHLFEVVCHCGTRFNPFMQQTDFDSIPDEAPAIAVVEAEEPLIAELPESSYVESTAAFQEIREFGETLREPEKKSSLPSPLTTGGGALALPVIPGTQYDGHAIENYLTPISVCVEINPAAENPLFAGWKALSEVAKKNDAQAVIGAQVNISHDWKKAIFLGIPVRSRKLSS